MILKWKNEVGFWCYEDLGENFAVHRGGITVPELPPAKDSETELRDLSTYGLEPQVGKYLAEKLNINNNVRILLDNTNGMMPGSYGFTVVTTGNKTIVLLGQQAYIMSESGKTIEKM